MNREIQALENNKTWYLTNLPNGKKPIGCKWVFKTKYNDDGTIERHKARLVAKRYSQLEGIDYFDTFSPVAKLTTVRIILALATAKDWYIYQLDVDNAFLHGDLNEEVYMTPPQELKLPKQGLVCRLTKSLYGLKQASRQWFAKLSSFLLKLGFAQSNSDYSLFIHKTTSTCTSLLVYVDDIILAGNSMEVINKTKSIMHHTFRIKDLGKLKYFLGFKISSTKKGIHMCQRKYALDILNETGMINNKPCQTPLMSDTKPLFDTNKTSYNADSYRRLIGKLLYLTNSRPDINYFVHLLSQFVQAPTAYHHQSAQHILRYLKAAPGRGLFFPRETDLQIKGFSDSDLATCPKTRRSITGYCVFLRESLISWKSKKHSTMSRSSSEVEYKALVTTSCEIQWISYILHDLCIQLDPPSVIYYDNQAAKHIAQNPSFHERTKHIDIDCHVIRECLQNNLFRLLPISSNDQLVHIFMKALHRTNFKLNVHKLGMLSIHHPA